MAIATTTQAIQTDFGRIAQQGAQQIQQSQLLEEQRQERQYNKMQDLEDRYGIPPEDFTLEDTEFRTLNDVQAEAMSSARDSYFDVYKQLEKDPTNVDLKKKLSRIKGSVASIRAANEKFMTLGEEYLTKLENDEISGVDEDDLFKNLQAIEKGRYKQRFDENGRLQILTYDKDGKLEDTLSYKELINRDVISRVKVDEELDGLMERLGEDNLTTAKGGRLVTTNQFGARQQQAAMDYINSTLGEGEETLEENHALADLLYQASGKKTKKRGNFTEEERTQVKEWMMNKIAGRYDNKVTMAADPVWAQQQANYRASNRTSSKEVSADDVKIGSNGEDPMITADGRVFFSIGKGGVAIDPNKKLSRMVSGIMQAPDGTLKLQALDTEKIKGVQDSNGNIDEVATAAEAKTTVASIFSQPDEDGNVTYYKRVPKTIDFKNEPDAVNILGNLLGVEDENGIRKLLKSKFYGKYKNKADDFYNGQLQASEEEKPQLDAFGNPI